MSGNGVNAPALILAAAVVLCPEAAPSAQDAQRGGAERRALIERAKVWMPTDVPSMNLREGPAGPDAFEPGATLTCDYTDKQMGGASPKFACRLPDGDELKVKYGGTNGEVYGEVAATRLLWALGFGADRMYSVRVICRGCPDHIGGILRPNGDRIIDPAAVERKFPAREVSDEWHWDELERVDPETGGATAAERDALKLLAVLLQHTDSKPQQQRLVCLDEADDEDAACEKPFMMINDLGLTFGRATALNRQPRASVNLAEWAPLPIWKGAHGCVGNLSGSWTGTLKDPVIGEAGRQFLAGLLMQLSDDQLRDMFQAARVHLRPRSPEDGRSGFPSAEEWVEAFKRKRAEIVERRCDA